MTLNWKALRPHIPLGPGATEYIPREGSAGVEIARWIGAGRSPLLVGGPAGVGKSTELACAATLLQPTRVACLVQLDRFENMRRLTPDRMLERIAQMIWHLATSVLHLRLSEGLQDALSAVDRELSGQLPFKLNGVTPLTLVNVAVQEVLRASRQDGITLLIDGLEKAPEGETTHDLFETLSNIHESVELVVVIPWHAAFGPKSDTVVRAGERFIAARALDVRRVVGRDFLREVLRRRLEMERAQFDEAPLELIDQAIHWSGGMPRVFLQLMADAGSYASLRGSNVWPTNVDLNDAVQDQVDSFRRLLLPGDAAAIRAVEGTTGNELELERKVRLMAHGVLLEREKSVLDTHPLTKFVLENLHA